MSRHEGVSCDSCLKGNFRGRRYKCLICYDYDLCATCYEGGATTTRHTTDHPMQCILTRSDFEMYYGGEGVTVEQPQAFTCPYCGRQGLTEGTLQEHVAAEHSDITHEVVCPVCASLPGGDPNHVTDDFAGHLTLEHRSGPRDLISFLDEPAVSRHGGVRRIPHSSRGSGVPRARRSNMHFSPSGGLSSLSPSSRDVDPIAELLSQLSGVRRSAAAAAAAAVTGAASGGSTSTVASTPSQLQQLQMQLQLERHQVRAARQQLERLPRRQAQAAASSGGAGVGLPATTNPLASMAATASANSQQIGDHTSGASSSGTCSAQGSQAMSQFLLARSLEDQISELDLQAIEQERAERSSFIQELVLSALAEDDRGGDLSASPNVSLVSTPIVESKASPPTSQAPQLNQQQQVHQLNRAQSKNHASHNIAASASPPVLAQQPKRSNSKGSLSKHATPSSSAPQPIVRAPVLPAQPIRVVTGTGTIRETPPIQSGMGVVPRNTAGGAGSGVVRGNSPPSNPTRRKPTRPIEGRNQATEPPPPH